MKKCNGGSRLNILLLLMILALGFIVIQKPGIEKAPSYQKISHLNPDEIQHIEINSTDKEKINFYKTDQIWHLKLNNQKNIIDRKELEPLFSLLKADSLESFSVTKNQLQQYHLLNPRFIVKFDNFSIAFGNSEPLKHRRYILVGNRVHLIADLHYHFLLQSTKTYTQIQK